MAYMSSTSTAPNVPVISHQVGLTGRLSWEYTSTHISSDIEEPNFFTDGELLGFKIRNFFLHYPTTDSTQVVTAHTVITVGATTTEIGVGTTLAGQAA